MAETYTEATLRRVQKEELNILHVFIDICNENSLTYCAIGGTALGTMRHNGFIPWDDDIDVAMPRKDYDQFVKLAPQILPKEYFFQNFATERNYNGYFSKIRKNKTAFVEVGTKKAKMHNGIFIDIFPLDNLPDNEYEWHTFHKKLYVLFQLYLAKSNIGVASNQKHKFWGLLVRKILHFLLIPVSKTYLFSCLDKMFMKYSDVTTKRLGFAYLPSMTLYYSELYPLKKMRFEDVFINVPNDIDAYLKRDYGNYMQLPPEEKRITHQPVVLDFENDYVP